MGAHDRDVRDIEATDTLRVLLAESRPLQRSAKATRRRVLAALQGELDHLRSLAAVVTPTYRPRHSAGDIMIRRWVA